MASPLRTCTVELTCDLTAPRAARHLVVLVLRQWGVHDQEVLDGATIVVSELVTNVLAHGDGSGPVQLAVELHGATVRLWVGDGSAVVPAQREAAVVDEDGRGLSIVSQLAVRWGIEALPDGKRVVVELPLPATSCA